MTVHKPNWTVLLLSMMMVLAPTLGVPGETLLQDTLKSIVVSFFALAASFAFFWHRRGVNSTIRVHSLLYLPLGLMAYALGSMMWSHAYLGGVEAIRWFVFSLIFFLGMNTLSLARVTQLAWGIHLGAVLASLWAALQFWIDFKFFAQGPNPASTFVNRNFFAEFLVCTLPFSALLLIRVKDKVSVFLLMFSLGFNIAALMMTGTRSALAALLILMLCVPGTLWLCRKQVASGDWRRDQRFALVALLIVTILGIGSINTGNPKLIAESGAGDAIDRAFSRTLSMTQAAEYSHGSFSVRAVMWSATGRMIQANPLAGVGAGAWEVHIPIYQEVGSQLETDYYAHNEILQLVAEYGLTGWLFLLVLMFYLIWAVYETWTNRTEEGQQEAPLRVITLSSLLALLLVSNAGFAWRMATTGALFALSLAILAASDIRLGASRTLLSHAREWRAGYARLAIGVTTLCTVLALYIAQQAIECEAKLVQAIKIALTITQSGRPNDPRWGKDKVEMLRLLRQGIAINPHYRKLTPIAADALAGWGDWKNATWIWESVIESRPKVTALLANAARGHMRTGNFLKAQEYVDRAKDLQPTASAVASLEVMLWSRTGREREAGLRAKELLQIGTVDYDLVQTAYVLGMRNREPELAIQALQLQIRIWPSRAIDGWLKLGNIYDSAEAKNESEAVNAYRAALGLTPAPYKSAVLAQIPLIYHAKIQ